MHAPDIWLLEPRASAIVDAGQWIFQKHIQYKSAQEVGARLRFRENSEKGMLPQIEDFSYYEQIWQATNVSNYFDPKSRVDQC